jgi:hypothetical protein
LYEYGSLTTIIFYILLSPEEWLFVLVEESAFYGTELLVELFDVRFAFSVLSTVLFVLL